MKRRTIILRLAACAALSALASGPAAAEPLLDKPVYFPHTKSYFELVRARPGQSIRGPNEAEIQWERAQAVAERRKYKGAAGRLAVVKDAETQAFLMRTFRPDKETIIGLRYYCRYNRLLWSTGDEHPRDAFANWGSPWRVGFACQGPNHTAVVFLDPKAGGQWRAHDQQKEFYTYFVEYPTGAP